MILESRLTIIALELELGQGYVGDLSALTFSRYSLRSVILPTPQTARPRDRDDSAGKSARLLIAVLDGKID